MIEFYPQIKQVHVLMVLLSGGLFALRGGALLAGARWPQATLARWTSWVIDSVLLSAALMLLSILPWAMFANGWLVTKLVLLVAYVLFGVLAFRRNCAPNRRLLWFVAALLCYLAMYSIARAHHPLGLLQGWVA